MQIKNMKVLKTLDLNQLNRQLRKNILIEKNGT